MAELEITKLTLAACRETVRETRRRLASKQHDTTYGRMVRAEDLWAVLDQLEAELGGEPPHPANTRLIKRDGGVVPS